eukprot:TRINITY_DN6224_c0_g1_i1.p1 TRINITY_DN6224_c0_g1~~TRINITY_DN6224_c0_g1_i1.p1  ORF type:complete len:174 (+),score=64.29 TRINITY_DN6224_c0_g1_i1:84-605(+)
MKFGKSISSSSEKYKQFIEPTLWIDYKNLKRNIKSGSGFQALLDGEFSKVEKTAEELVTRVVKLVEDAPDSKANTVLDHKNAELFRECRAIEAFINENMEGVRKICKKMEKKDKSNAGLEEKYKARCVETFEVFLSELSPAIELLFAKSGNEVKSADQSDDPRLMVMNAWSLV